MSWRLVNSGRIKFHSLRRVGLFFVVLCLWMTGGFVLADGQGIVLSTEGKVEHSASRSNWSKATPNQKLQTADRLRTLALSRAMVQLMELGRMRLNELTTLEILPPRNTQSKGTLDLKAGAIYFFTRDAPREFEIQTPQALAASRGTEFLVSLEADGRERFVVYDGEVELTNTLGAVVVGRGEQGVVEPGQAPRKTAVTETTRVVQWWLYYAAVVDPDELEFTSAQQQVVAEPIAAYRAGDLLAALDSYPEGRTPDNDSERAFLATLLLSVGQVAKADELLREADASSPLAAALRLMIDTVQGREARPLANPAKSTEWLANSYLLQSRLDLEGALAAAREAAQLSPKFGFAQARVAELEFSFGRSREAAAMLEKAIASSPRNAQAWALKGFLLSAQRKWSAAAEAFDQAIALDPALGNAWLGRGLLKIRGGDGEAGRADLQTAAALEPRRSVLRSYLGKGFANDHDPARAVKELKLAQQLDPNDPTSWLYLALLEQQENKINNAIGDLEQSKALNDNRAVFRSRLLLDQDQAVRSANLARIYQDNGMNNVGLNEASRAVVADYANSSAHLFLSDAYNDLRDPTQFNLRYETVWFNELLLANALAPVGGGRLSQGLSQQEYSRLFATDGFGLSSMSDYRTDGMFHQQASQFGSFGNTAYSLDLNYHRNDGVRPNNSLDDIEWNTTIKQQITAQDTAMLLVQYQDYHSGDNFQYYNPTNARPDFKFEEHQEPILVGTWHHEWSPGMHTLVILSRLTDEQRFSDVAAPQLLLLEDGAGTTVAATSNPFDVDYRNDFEIYGAELNQIAQWNRVTLVAGGRYQSGEFRARNVLDNPGPLGPLFDTPPADDSIDGDFDRVTGYGYLTVEPVEKLWLTAGAAYDAVKFPSNYRAPPVSSGQEKRAQLGPKAALVWSPVPQATLRGYYAQSLGGVSLDESYRLEPTQLGGFPQAFRSLISESAVGSVAAPKYETFGLALDFRLGTRTYATIQGERLGTKVRRDIGTFTLENGLPPFATATTPEHLDFEEYNLTVSLNQLVGEQFVVGARYTLTDAELRDTLTEIPVSALATADQKLNARLHQATGYVLWNHPSGLFARADVQWYSQHNSGYATPMPGDEFLQENLFVGYRFFHRRAEIRLGLLNISDQDYRLNPLAVYAELPRERVFQARFSFVF